MWMGVLKVEAVGKGYNIPWGDVSSAVSVLTTRNLVVVLDNDPHFKYIVEIVKELKKNIEIVRISCLSKFLAK